MGQRSRQSQRPSIPEMGAERPDVLLYRRHLPHIQVVGRTFFVTFKTKAGRILVPRARDSVLRHCLYEHKRKAYLHVVVVMPNHVHIVLTPLVKDDGEHYLLHRILAGIKGASARSVNRQLGRTGAVWQDESFDHLLRSWDSIESKVNYVIQNPIRAGLAGSEGEYRWTWCEWLQQSTTGDVPSPER